jgi:DNA modification methylase
MEQLMRSIAEDPELVHARPLIVNENYEVIAGNQRLRACVALGWKEVPCVVVNWDEAKQKRAMIKDNVSAGEWDWDLLANEWDAEELNEWGLEVPLEEEPVEGLTDEDEVPEVPEEPQTKPGDLWILGDHRLLCGDSTKADDVERLMDGNKADMAFTDPPYGVNYEGGHFHSGDVNIKRKREKLANDGDDQIYTDVIPLIAAFCDGPCYTWFAGTKPLKLYQAVEALGQIHSLLIWHKTNATYAAMNAQYKQRHEPCLYWKPKGSNLRWCGPSNEATIWEMKRDATNNFHPTQKPVELAERALKNHDAKSVLDFFLGSGSTLIAAEKTGRKCYGMELDPKYCDVIVKRWEDFTGKKAELCKQ